MPTYSASFLISSKLRDFSKIYKEASQNNDSFTASKKQAIEYQLKKIDDAYISARAKEAKNLYNLDVALWGLAALPSVGGMTAGITIAILSSGPIGLLIIGIGLLLTALTLTLGSVGRSSDQSRAITENILQPIRFFTAPTYNGVDTSALENELQNNVSPA